MVATTDERGGLRCLAYTRRSIAPWLEGELVTLAGCAARKNAMLGVTRRLIYFNDTFTQMIEGPAQAVAQVFEAIQADPRHANIQILFDAPLLERSCPNTALEFIAPVDVVANAQQAGFYGLESDADADRIIGDAMRVTPLQPRGIKTVERILLAAGRLSVRRGST